MPNISKFRKPIIIALLCFISILMYAQNGKTYKNLIFKSKILGKDIIYNIYLPPDYLDSKEIPALYNLHGFGGNHYSSEILTSVIDSLIVQKEFQKLIIVSPNADKTWYVDNWDESVLYSSMFIKEFIPFIKKDI